MFRTASGSRSFTPLGCLKGAFFLIPLQKLFVSIAATVKVFWKMPLVILTKNAKSFTSYQYSFGCSIKGRDRCIRDGHDRSFLKGERDPKKLASLAHFNVKKSPEEIAKALTRAWREEHLFELRQSYEVYQYFHQKISECDLQIEKLLTHKIEENEKKDGEARLEYTGKLKKKNKNDPKIDLQTLSFQLTGGIDLSLIEGISRNNLMCILLEIGIELSAFPSAGNFTSWLRLAHNNKISGGKLLSKRTNRGKNRLADALRHAANIIGNSVKKGYLHQFFIRIAYKKGQLVAITATARKLAVIIWNMLTKKQSYQPVDQADYLTKVRTTQVKNLQRKITQLKITPDELSFATI